MRHRAALRSTSPPRTSRSTEEIRLEQAQARLARFTRQAEEAAAERDHLALQLWLDDRMTQAEIAERLDRADRRAGGIGVTYAQLQRRLHRNRQTTGAVA